MKRLLILVTMVLGLAFGSSPVESADATSAWNSVAASYNFATTYSGGINPTFAQAYRGSNFNADFAGILNAVAGIMSSQVPPVNGNDLLNATLQNWPNP